MMCLWVGLLLVINAMALLVSGHEGHEHFQPREGNREDLLDKRLREDRQHLKEDIENYLNVNPQLIDQASPKELEYFYFVIHDFDKNSKLDGIEMTKAVLHIIDHNHPDHIATVESISGAMDQVLFFDDLDRDGFISYPEFILSKERNSK